MEKFDVYILGCGSAQPTMQHLPSCQVVDLREKLFMIDCGEGAQQQLRRYRLGFARLNHIFISHLHGDHCFGLPGLISTLGLLGRTSDLHVYAPEDFGPMLQHILEFFCSQLSFKVVFHGVDTARHDVVYDDRSVTVWSLPLVHRVPCCGYHFVEKATADHIRRDMTDFYGIPVWQLNIIKNGAGWTTPDGTVVPHERLTTPAARPRSYAYCSDTIYRPQLAQWLQGVDVLYHEATYASTDGDVAKRHFHSTAEQAAMLARDSGAGRLCIGHFSHRYENEGVLLDEAKAVFPNTVLATEGLKLEI
jgi:ribonuclease Z